jgi:chromosome segregation ATPase
VAEDDCSKVKDLTDKLRLARLDVTAALDEKAQARDDAARFKKLHLAVAEALAKYEKAHATVRKENKALKTQMKDLKQAKPSIEEDVSPPAKRKRETQGVVLEVEEAAIEDDFACLDVVDAPRPAWRAAPATAAAPREPLIAKIIASTKPALGPKQRKRVS